MFRKQTPSVRVAGLIRAELAKRGIRSTEVGEWLNLGPGAISRRLNEWTPFSVDDVGTIAGRLGLSPGDLGAALIGPGDENGPRIEGTRPRTGDHTTPTTGTD